MGSSELTGKDINRIINKEGSIRKPAYFHKVFNDPVIRLRVGKYGAMNYILDENDSPISNGGHSFFKDDRGNLMLSLGASESIVSIGDTNYPFEYYLSTGQVLSIISELEEYI